MKTKLSSKGTTKYAWVEYESLLKGKNQNLQVIEWPNGEGLTFWRTDETTLDLDWDEWDAMKLAVRHMRQEGPLKKATINE